MDAEQYMEAQVNMPLSIFFRGRRYIGELHGRMGEALKFSFRIPGGYGLELEAIGSKPGGGHIWKASGGRELASYVSYIGRHIERCMGSKGS